MLLAVVDLVSSFPSASRRRLRTARLRPSTAGFSLVELMVVVLLIGISASMVAPGLMRSMAIGRTNRFQYDVARVLRRTRSDAIGTGRAHLLVLGTAGPYTTLSLYRGDSSSCVRSQWGVILAGDAPVDVVSTGSYNAGGHSVQIARSAVTPTQICFEPDGDRVGRNGAAFVLGNGDYVYTISRNEPDAANVDPPRNIVISAFATPRVAR